MNEIFFFIFPRTLKSLPFKIQNNNINNAANTTLYYYLKTFAELKKTNTLANCKDREKERGGRALS